LEGVLGHGHSGFRGCRLLRGGLLAAADGSETQKPPAEVVGLVGLMSVSGNVNMGQFGDRINGVACYLAVSYGIILGF